MLLNYMIYTIYKLTNKLTLECYIGFTKNLNRRIWGHLSKANEDSNAKLYVALREYGIENFDISVLYQSKDRDYCLNVMEPHFIKEHDSIATGYNQMTGGVGVSKGTIPWNKGKSGIYSKEVLSKMSASHKGSKAWNKGLPNPQGAENARKGAEKLASKAAGRKRHYFTETNWTWKYPNEDGWYIKNEDGEHIVLPAV